MGAINAFGNLLPILGATTSAIRTLEGAATTLSGIGQSADKQRQDEQNLAMKQLKRAQAAQEQNLAQQTALERERIAAQGAQDEDERRQALRRAVARQRAQFGSQGTGAAGGSADAVLLGLFDETDDDLAKREQLDSLRNRALDLDVAQNRSLNLLQAMQLAQRQSLSRLF